MPGALANSNLQAAALRRQPESWPRAGTSASPLLEEVEPTRDPHVIRREIFGRQTGTAEALLEARISADEVQLADPVLDNRRELTCPIRRQDRVIRGIGDRLAESSRD